MDSPKPDTSSASQPPETIGLLSDSHGNVDITREAVNLLMDHDCDLLIHLGDVESRLVLDQLAGLPARVVFGNCDDERDLAAYAQAIDLQVDHPAGILPLPGGRSLGFTHGHDSIALRSMIAKKPDFIAHGHSHAVRDEIFDGIRYLNPGALHRATRYTVGLLRPRTDVYEVLEVASSGSG